MASEAIKKMIFQQMFAQGAKRKEQELAKRRGEFTQGLMGSPEQAQETSQFQADTFPGEAPLQGLMNIDQQAQPASGMFDENVPMQQRQMQFNKGLMGSEFPILQEQGFDAFSKMGGGVKPPDFLNARTFESGAPKEMVDGVNVNKGKVQRYRNTVDGGIKALGDPRYPRDPFKNLGDAFVNQNAPGNRMTIENRKKAKDTAAGTSEITRRDAALKDANKKMDTFNESIGLYDQAITELGNGATVGKIQNYAPSFKRSTLALKNIGSRLGLNIIKSVTFGSLSEAEMKLAMQTGMPDDMTPEGLKIWLTDKKAATEKLRDELIRYGQFVEQGGTKMQWAAAEKKKRDDAKANTVSWDKL